MKIIIDIPQETYDFLNKYGTDGGIIEKAIVNGTPISDNVTNGDIIKAMFPYINDKPNRVQNNGNKIVIYIDMGFGWITIEFEKEWWNEPYKGME